MSLYSTEYEIIIPFYDLDPMNVVWHGNYVKYMEKARCDLFSKLGYTYMDMKDDGYMYPVAKMTTKFIKSARFDDVIVVKTSLLSVEPSLNMKYTILNKDNEKIFEAETMQIAVNIDTEQSTYTAPPRLIAILE